jgi:hypothetical protein
MSARQKLIVACSAHLYLFYTSWSGLGIVPIEYSDPGIFWNIEIGLSIIDNNLEYYFTRDDTDLPFINAVVTSA